MVGKYIKIGFYVLIVFFSFQAGKNWNIAKTVKIELKEVKKDEKKVNQVIEYRDKIKVVYRDKIIKIKQAKDSTGCADTKLTDMGFGL